MQMSHDVEGHAQWLWILRETSILEEGLQNLGEYSAGGCGNGMAINGHHGLQLEWSLPF